VKMVERKKQRI